MGVSVHWALWACGCSGWEGLSSHFFFSMVMQYINYSETRPDYVSLFQNYRGGVGGACSVYSPPFSYWYAVN